MPTFIRPPSLLKSVPTSSTVEATDIFASLAPINNVINLSAVQALRREQIGAGHVEQFSEAIGLHPEDPAPENDLVSVPAITFAFEGDACETWYFCGPERTLAEWAVVRDAVEQSFVDNSYHHDMNLEIN
ncbi:hypothetical protein pEaSNUABM21_00027 [Erwinia phage pEa_SNUABM_21]|nr:hypothetical protein pEaSNUABM21_00027 [Erwinia phage pEa_SNUABM_21]